MSRFWPFLQERPFKTASLNKFFRPLRRAIPNRSTSKQAAASNNLECVGEGSAPLLHTWFVSGHGTPSPERDKCQGTDSSVHTIPSPTVILSVTERRRREVKSKDPDDAYRDFARFREFYRNICRPAQT